MKHLLSRVYKQLVLASFVMMPIVANATTWYVKSGGTGDCSGWATACGSLETAKTKVTKNTDEIWVATGIYRFSAQVVTGTYVLRIYGGFAGTETALESRDPVKNVVVFSADTPANDSGVVGGVTPSYTNISGAATARILSFLNTGVTSASATNVLDGVTLTGMLLEGATRGGLVIENAKAEINNVKFIGNKGHAPGVYLGSPFSSAKVTNTEFTNNYSLSASGGIEDGGAIYATGAEATLTCDNCKFTGNRAKTTGGAVKITGGANVTVSNSGFTSNVAETGAGGAVNNDSTGAVKLTSNLFDANQALVGNGGGLVCTAGTLTILSNTFFGNIAGSNSGKFGGGINLGAGNCHAVIKYSTFMNNTAIGTGGKGGAINVNTGYPVTLPVISHSMFFNNTSPTGANISDMGSVTDGGYNLIGFAGTSNVAGTWTKASTSITTTEATLSKIVETTLDVNGGNHKSVKLAANSMAIDAIANDIPVSSVGTTPSNPFTSIAQARGAMANYGGYVAGKYFFDLSGTTFATYVDKNGYVLVASSDSENYQAAPYTQVSTLALRSDSILNSSIMAKFTTSEIDEVRISSNSNGVRGTFDGYTNSLAVINNLRLYLTLNNTFNGGNWIVTGSSKAVNYFTATGNPTSYSLDRGIYHASGNTNGIHWIPEIPYESLVFPDTGAASKHDDLDLWVRSSKGNCNGSVATDQRGLPRADYANPNDPNQYGDINRCDIGAFEWNDGYQNDCYSEDGDRTAPVFGTTETEFQVCLGANATPKALLDSLGFASYSLLIMMGMMGLCRRKLIVSVKAIK